MMKAQLLSIRRGLLACFPELAQEVERRFATLSEQLDATITTVDKLLRAPHKRGIIVSHGAYGYLCTEYGIEQLSLEAGGKEASASSLGALLRRAQAEKTTTVFAIALHSQRGIRRLAQLLHAKVVALDPYGAEYFSTQVATAAAFQEALAAE